MIIAVVEDVDVVVEVVVEVEVDVVVVVVVNIVGVVSCERHVEIVVVVQPCEVVVAVVLLQHCGLHLSTISTPSSSKSLHALNAEKIIR